MAFALILVLIYFYLLFLHGAYSSLDPFHPQNMKFSEMTVPDRALLVVSVLWMVCAIGLFFRQRWAWWGNLLSLLNFAFCDHLGGGQMIILLLNIGVILFGDTVTVPQKPNGVNRPHEKGYENRPANELGAANRASVFAGFA